MNLSFFATDDDLLDLVQWLLGREQFRIFEGASLVDRPIREVRMAADFVEIRDDEEGALLLRGWSPAFTNAPKFRRIDLNPNVGNHRTVLEGVGIVQFERGRLVDDKLYPACISHWNEAGARAAYGGAFSDEVDWAGLRRASGRIRRAVKAKAGAMLGSMPVLRGAFEQLENGEIMLWNFGASIESGAPELQRVEPTRMPARRR